MSASSLYLGSGGGQTGGRPPSIEDMNLPLFREICENVRFFLRDFQELNRLTKGFDHSKRHIMWAILDTLSDFASTPPFIGVDLSTIISRGWQHMFIRGVTISLLESLMFLHLRNFLSYSDGGTNVQTENPSMLQATIQMMKNEYEQKKKQALIAANIEGALQGVGAHSEYLFVNSFWGAL
jgi:hypothetical protein